ncbi:hypothetical protein MMPV_007447 [Pyropia vietnamensis]
MKVSAASVMVVGVATSLMAATTTLMATTCASAVSGSGVEHWTPSVESGLQLPEWTVRDVSLSYNGKRYPMNDDASCKKVGEALEKVMRDKDLSKNVVWTTLDGWKEGLKRKWKAYRDDEQCARALVRSISVYVEQFTLDKAVAKKLKKAAKEHGAFDSGGTKGCARAQKKCCTSWSKTSFCMFNCQFCTFECNRLLKKQQDNRYIIEDFNEGRWCFARLMDGYSRGLWFE